MLAASVHRLHDMGTSGWRILIHVIPVMGTIVCLVGMIREGDPSDTATVRRPDYAPGSDATEPLLPLRSRAEWA